MVLANIRLGAGRRCLCAQWCLSALYLFFSLAILSGVLSFPAYSAWGPMPRRQIWQTSRCSVGSSLNPCDR